MGIINTNHSIGGTTDIPCNGSLQVTLGITAAPDIMSDPTDIVLALDRSGSMGGRPLADLKAGVNKFIDIIAGSTDGAPDETGSGSRIGIVSFADTAARNTGLTTSAASLKSVANGLEAGGSTNHGDAFSQAMDLLGGSGNNRVIVMFTDGVTTAGPDPSPIVAQAKAMGVTVYVIGLAGDTGVDEDTLKDWASEPGEAHVAIAPTSADLEQIFAGLAVDIVRPGATDICIDEVLNPDFKITSSPTASLGSISQLTADSFRWSVSELGTASAESAAATFTIQHMACGAGPKKISRSVAYSDAEGNAVTFADPSVWVHCAPSCGQDPSPVPGDDPADGCGDCLQFDAGGLDLEDAGRIVQLSVTLRDVLPNRRVALAVMLTEEDGTGTAQPRGVRMFTVPAHTLPTCSDVLVSGVRFILPDDGRGLCAERSLHAQLMAHYIDSDFTCGPTDVAMR